MAHLPEHQMDLILEYLQKQVPDKNMVKFKTITGVVDLEVVISLSEDDSILFSEKKLAEIKKEVIRITGLPAPVVYMNGYLPQELMRV